MFILLCIHCLSLMNNCRVRRHQQRDLQRAKGRRQQRKHQRRNRLPKRPQQRRQQQQRKQQQRRKRKAKLRRFITSQVKKRIPLKNLMFLGCSMKVLIWKMYVFTSKHFILRYGSSYLSMGTCLSNLPHYSLDLSFLLIFLI